MTFPAACDLLVTNGHVLTMDGDFTAFPDGAVAIEVRSAGKAGQGPSWTRVV